MLKGKSRIAMLAASGVIAALMVGSIVVASNMGFKARFQLTGGVSNWFSAPYTSPYATANDLLNAAAPTSGGQISRYIPSDPPAIQFWTGSTGNGSPFNFVLKPGEGYDIVPNVNEDVVLVGAHDPFVTIPAGQDGLPAVGSIPLGGSIPPGFVPNRDYLVAVPYHTTYAKIDDMLKDMPGASGVITKVVHNVGSPPAYFFWTGTTGNDTPKNFAVVLGQAYLVRVLTASSGITPAHF
jgi:hypothetical protein